MPVWQVLGHIEPKSLVNVMTSWSGLRVVLGNDRVSQVEVHVLEVLIIQNEFDGVDAGGCGVAVLEPVVAARICRNPLFFTLSDGVVSRSVLQFALAYAWALEGRVRDAGVAIDIVEAGVIIKADVLVDSLRNVVNFALEFEQAYRLVHQVHSYVRRADALVTQASRLCNRVVFDSSKLLLKRRVIVKDLCHDSFAWGRKKALERCQESDCGHKTENCATFSFHRRYW